MTIQLLHFAGCPNVARARAALHAALAAEALDTPVEEIDLAVADAPAWARGWGSPTILIDGLDVMGQPPSAEASCCRLYAEAAPSIEAIRARIAMSRGGR